MRALIVSSCYFDGFAKNLDRAIEDLEKEHGVGSIIDIKLSQSYDSERDEIDRTGLILYRPARKEQ